MLRILEEALTFDDVLLVPAHSLVLPNKVDLKTRLTRSITLNIPLVSSAMDTVTEARLAIAMAQEGGIGIIHKNMGIEAQAKEVRTVKKYASGVVPDPRCITPATTVRTLMEMTRETRISGMPVIVETDGKRELVGIVTSRDVRFERDLNAKVSSIMTPKERLVTAKEGASLEDITQLMHKSRIEKVLMINDAFELRGLVTLKDIRKAEDHPNACKDSMGHLRVGAAVGTGADTEERVRALVAAGVDVIVVDTSHGHSQEVLKRIRQIKDKFPAIALIGGNVATAAGALALVEAGVDSVKVGIGPGSICTTRIVTGVGVPQITAVSNVAAALKGTDVTIISDGGIRFSGDIAKAIAAGANAVMIGSLLAGTEEAPGEVELYQGRSYKAYRGMGSLGAMAKGSSDRYFQTLDSGAGKLVPEGVEGRVPYKGTMSAIVFQLIGGVRSSMGLTGCANIEEMRVKPQFVKITSAGVSESHVHDVTITKEAPNYRIG